MVSKASKEFIGPEQKAYWDDKEKTFKESRGRYFDAHLVRYKNAREMDYLDVGTTLGKFKVMHDIDWLQILPDGEDEFYKYRQK